MEKKTVQKIIMTMRYEDFASFLFFLSTTYYDYEVMEKWQTGPDSIQFSLYLPLETDIWTFSRQWFDWRNNLMEQTYAVWN